MMYFNPNKTPLEQAARWKELCKLHHPDKGGDVKIMQAINEQYAAIKRGDFRQPAPPPPPKSAPKPKSESREESLRKLAFDLMNTEAVKTFLKTEIRKTVLKHPDLLSMFERLKNDL